MYLEERGVSDVRAEIHKAILSQFCLQGEFLIEKLLVKDKGSKVLMWVNPTPVIRCLKQYLKSHIVHLSNALIKYKFVSELVLFGCT